MIFKQNTSIFSTQMSLSGFPKWHENICNQIKFGTLRLNDWFIAIKNVLTIQMENNKNIYFLIGLGIFPQMEHFLAIHWGMNSDEETTYIKYFNNKVHNRDSWDKQLNIALVHFLKTDRVIRPF